MTRSGYGVGPNSNTHGIAWEVLHLNRWLPLILLSSIACSGIFENNKTAIEMLNAEIVSFQECIIVGPGGCIPGELFNDSLPLDTAAVPWGEPFIVNGKSSFARFVTWTAENETCRDMEACPFLRSGPLQIAETRYHQVVFILNGTEQNYLILQAELEGRIVADTVLFYPPPPPPGPE